MAVSRGVAVALRSPSTAQAAGEVPVVGVLSAVRHAGESVYGAALRALRDAGLPDLRPWGVDLSGVRAVLAADVPDAGRHGSQTAGPSSMSPRHDGDAEVARLASAVPAVSVAFRPMTRADLPSVVRWVAQPHVRRWWDDEADDLARAERHYRPAIDGDDPTRMWVVEVNGRSVGFVQDYLIGDHPDFALLTARPDAVGFDYAIGEPAWVGRGLGTRLLWEFLRDVVGPHRPDAPEYFAAPDHRNAASLRVLDKLGFERGLWFDEPQSGGRVATVVGCALDVRRVLGRPTRLVTEG
jgi:aminoglycoside 6'-N-acetyltransferase